MSYWRSTIYADVVFLEELNEDKKVLQIIATFPIAMAEVAKLICNKHNEAVRENK